MACCRGQNNIADEERPDDRRALASGAPASDGPLVDPNPVPGVLCFKVWGLVGALVVVALFAALSWGLRSWWKVPGLTLIEPVSYYWMMFAILTWLWEICFISFKFRETRTYADYLMAADKHVWLTSYGWQMILPWNTAVVFYAEYGAWADRDYSALKLDENLWARAIEGSHGFAAGGFSLLAMIFAAQFSQAQLLITMSVGMAAQGMNAFLYLASYTLLVFDPSNPNYSTEAFPCGVLAWRRPFMWINVFWVVLPLYVVIKSLALAGSGAPVV